MHILTKLTKKYKVREIRNYKGENKMTSRRALFSLPDGVWKIIDNEPQRVRLEMEIQRLSEIL